LQAKQRGICNFNPEFPGWSGAASPGRDADVIVAILVSMAERATP
jgi:hypothetical protein